jgi:hypothetical protein
MSPSRRNISACNVVNVMADAVGQGFSQVKSPTSDHTHKPLEGVEPKS